MEFQNLTLKYGNPKNWEASNLILKWQEKEKYPHEFVKLIQQEIAERGGIDVLQKNIEKQKADEIRLLKMRRKEKKELTIKTLSLVVALLILFFGYILLCRLNESNLDFLKDVFFPLCCVFSSWLPFSLFWKRTDKFDNEFAPIALLVLIIICLSSVILIIRAYWPETLISTILRYLNIILRWGGGFFIFWAFSKAVEDTSITSIGSSSFSVNKSCSNCGKSVPLFSKARDRCPHCGAYWSYERRI